MTVNLIPQDELTLNLLAEVLAKMYQFYLKSKDDAHTEDGEPDSSISSAGPEKRYQGQATSERDLTQVERA